MSTCICSWPSCVACLFLVPAWSFKFSSSWALPPSLPPPRPRLTLWLWRSCKVISDFRLGPADMFWGDAVKVKLFLFHFSAAATAPLPFQNKRFADKLTWWICITPQGHSSFITHLDWSVDSQYLVSNSGDYEILHCECFTAFSILLYFKIIWCHKIHEVNFSLTFRAFLCCTTTSSGIPSVCKQVTSVETTRDLDWATSTCPLGFHVFGKRLPLPFSNSYFLSRCCIWPSALSSGLWPDGSDGTDVNAVCRSHDRGLLVTGDDFGKVHLFSYPCSQFRVRYKQNTHPADKILLTLIRLSCSKCVCFF